MKTRNLIIAGLLLLTLWSCKKENEDVNDDLQTVVLDVSKDLFNWVYFSFSSSDVVAVTDFQNDLNWDLGIRYENFRTNGGESGIGEGGVYDLGEIDFNSVTMSSILSASFTEDDSINVIISMGMPPQYDKVPGSIPLEDMFLSPTSPTSRTYAPNNHVYVIRTANGKHVKFIGTSFFNDLAEEGHLNFRFMFMD